MVSDFYIGIPHGFAVTNLTVTFLDCVTDFK